MSGINFEKIYQIIESYTNPKFVSNIMVKILYLFIFLVVIFNIIITPQLKTALQNLVIDNLDKTNIAGLSFNELITREIPDIKQISINNFINRENPNSNLNDRENSIDDFINRENPNREQNPKSFTIDTFFSNDKNELDKIEKIIPLEKYSTKNYNKLLLSIQYLIIIFLVLGIMLIYVYNRKDIPILKILVFNFLLFCVVGMIEYMFFMKVASKYIPVKSSDMVKMAKDILLT